MLESAATSLSRPAFGDALSYDLVGVGRRLIEADSGALQSAHLDLMSYIRVDNLLGLRRGDRRKLRVVTDAAAGKRSAVLTFIHMRD